MRISCPPTISPCYYGIDTPLRDELIAGRHSVPEIREFIGADTLGYLSHEGMMQAVGIDGGEACTACWTERYPVALPAAESEQLRLFDKTRR